MGVLSIVVEYSTYTYIIAKNEEKINLIKLYGKIELKISYKSVLSERFSYKIRIKSYFMNIHIINKNKGDIFMEYAKEKFFEVIYNTKLDKLVIKKERWVSKIKRFIRTHKFITTASIAFCMFSTLNIVMIYSFMKILQNI